MMDDSSVLAEIDAAFGSTTRPQQFTVQDGDPECMDHDALLSSRTPSTLSLKDVGNVCWDPLCECLPAGIAYLFPALARFALARPTESGYWYGGQLIFHLSYDGANNRFLHHCSQCHRAAVASLLAHIIESRHVEIDGDGSSVEEFETCLSLWRGIDK